MSNLLPSYFIIFINLTYRSTHQLKLVDLNYVSILGYMSRNIVV